MPYSFPVIVYGKPPFDCRIYLNGHMVPAVLLCHDMVYVCVFLVALREVQERLGWFRMYNITDLKKLMRIFVYVEPLEIIVEMFHTCYKNNQT